MEFTKETVRGFAEQIHSIGKKASQDMSAVVEEVQAMAVKAGFDPIEAADALMSAANAIRDAEEAVEEADSSIQFLFEKTEDLPEQRDDHERHPLHDEVVPMEPIE